jgi:hypothetical protein
LLIAGERGASCSDHPPPKSLLGERPAQYTFHCSLRVLLS